VSTVTFGYIDFNEIFGGEEGLNYYSNVGVDHWAIMMDDFQYNNMGLNMPSSGRMAIIDSGNTSI
jgi:hypothetical protein